MSSGSSATAAYSLGCIAALGRFKCSEWNWEMTGRPLKKDKISPDNGRRAYGVNFDEPGRPSRAVGQAFNSLNSTKPSDFLNEGNEGMIGAT